MESLHDRFAANGARPDRRTRGAMKRLVLALLAVAIVTAGCASEKVDKTGKPVRDKPVVLTLADHENSTLDVQNWIDEVQRRSGGTIRIRVESGWRGQNPDYDRATIADVRAGRIDIAKIAARSWDEVGVQSFRALVAPMLIDSYALEQRVLTSGLPTQMLQGVNKRDLAGLAVLPGLLRKPLGVSRRTPPAAGLRRRADRDPPGRRRHPDVRGARRQGGRLRPRRPSRSRAA